MPLSLLSDRERPPVTHWRWLRALRGIRPHPPCLWWSPRLPAHRPHSEDQKALAKVPLLPPLQPPGCFECR